MRDEHDHDLQSTVEAEGLEELADDPMDTAMSVAIESARDGKLAALGGGLLLLSTLRSLARGQLRTLPKAAVAAGLLGIGLRQRRSSGPTTFEPSTDEIGGETEGKKISDEARGAAERPDSGQESQIDGSGDVEGAAQLGDEGDTGSRIEFTDEPENAEPRSKPDAEKDEGDPRRDTDDGTEIDVSNAAMAEETSEATGPDPEQAQPTQTDATEPEETPEEDASDMKVEPDEDEGEDSEADDEDET